MKISRKNNPVLVRRNNPNMRSIFDELFTHSFEEFFNDLAPISTNTDADIWEEGDNYFIKMALPGINKNKINIEIDSDVVRISAGDKNEEEKKEEKGRRYFYKSLSSYFEQTFNLPTPVDADGAEASFVDGVLEIKLPKASNYKPKKLEIK